MRVSSYYGVKLLALVGRGKDVLSDELHLLLGVLRTAYDTAVDEDAHRPSIGCRKAQKEAVTDSLTVHTHTRSEWPRFDGVFQALARSRSSCRCATTR